MTQRAILAASTLAAVLTLVPPRAVAQNASCSLSATVYDSSNAVIPNAKAVLRGETTNMTRETVSNERGFFTLSAIQPGSYTVTITAPKFAAWEQHGIVFNQGESRTLPNVVLHIATVASEVHVVAAADATAPIDSGEARQTLSGELLSHVAVQGRDAAELIKIMPGMGMNRGLSQTGWSSRVTQSNSGPIGQYSASGTQPNGALTMTMDGANLLDPGNQGTQVANINQDQTAEVTLLYSAYGAEYAKGPVTFQAISKSGTPHFHGSLYVYGYCAALDSTESLTKAMGGPKGQYRSAYPGGDIGGPVLIPGTKFNRQRDKLFFYIGPEGMLQQPAPIYHSYFLPTTGMLNGNFSPAYLRSLGAGLAATKASDVEQPTEHGAAAAYPGGMIPASLLDPTSLAYAKTFPQLTREQPDAGGNNYFFQSATPVNRFEFKARLDYNVSDNNKLFVSWNRQDEFDQNPIGVWWYPWNALPYPSPMPVHQVSNVYSASFVHLFSPTLTNEMVLTLVKFSNPIRLTDPAAVNSANLGLTGYKPLAADPYMAQMPNIISWSGLIPGYYAPSFGTSFQNGDFGKISLTPSIADNLTKVVGTHTMKFGLYWDFARNNQPGGLGNWAQGMVEFDNTGGTTSGNVMADFLTGRTQSFQQVPALSVYNLLYNQYALYAQDQWKASHRLTLTLGIRLDHLGQWYPTGGPGLAVWDPYSYNNTPSAGPWTGLSFHGTDSKLPISGFPSKLFFPDPRIGFAFDPFGKGRTVLRGGFGVYRYQLSYNSAVSSGEYDEAAGIPNYNISNPPNLGWNFAQYGPPSNVPGIGTNIGAMQMGDARTPYTESYNLTISQRAPWHSTIELGYSGNISRDLLLSGNGFGTPYLGNLNKTPLGAYFLPDPLTGAINDPAQGGLPLQDYRSYHNYQTIALVSHGSYQNYNAMVATWNKQTGRATFMVNYTFGKVLGIRDGETDNGAGNGPAMDPWNLRNNYGPLAYDHTQIFNAAYSVRLPSPLHGDMFIQHALNGWTISGATQVQSGAPIQPNTGGNMWLTTAGGLNSQMWLGTDSANIMPALTCDPRSNLKSGQYFNPACFALGPQGTNGPTVWPYIHGPAYFHSDLSIYKNFQIRERHSIEVRLDSFNFLNHPLKTFNANGANTDLSLVFNTPVAGATNSNLLTTGAPLYTTGLRLVMVAVKYKF
ncbi:MAG: TonB-dependent receptor [Bryobacteraceae bacterium]|nr:TonB-dependent receptor [Bryobacteraceae bacterium]